MYKQGGGEFRIRVNRFYTPSSVTSKENKSSVDAGYLNKNTQIQLQMTCGILLINSRVHTLMTTLSTPRINPI